MIIGAEPARTLSSDNVIESFEIESSIPFLFRPIDQSYVQVQSVSLLFCPRRISKDQRRDESQQFDFFQAQGTFVLKCKFVAAAPAMVNVCKNSSQIVVLAKHEDFWYNHFV